MSRVLFCTWRRAGSRVVHARRVRCFVCRQRAMSRVSARRLHAVEFEISFSSCDRSNALYFVLHVLLCFYLNDVMFLCIHMFACLCMFVFAVHRE